MLNCVSRQSLVLHNKLEEVQSSANCVNNANCCNGSLSSLRIRCGTSPQDLHKAVNGLHLQHASGAGAELLVISSHCFR
jgi:hypothetical protein